MAFRLSAEQVRRMDAYWRATLYLCAGMLYLRRNPLLREPPKPEHIKRRLLGHWGSDPGQTFKDESCRQPVRLRDRRGPAGGPELEVGPEVLTGFAPDPTDRNGIENDD